MAISFNDELALDRIIRNEGATWSDIVGTATVFDYFSDSAVVDDAIYFNSYIRKQKGIRVNVGTVVVADTLTVVWEYYTAGGWTALANVTDPTNGFQNAGDQLVTWDMPTDWRNNSYLYAGGSYAYSAGYCVRCRITAVTNITEGGANSTNTVKSESYAIRITGGTTYVPVDLYNADVAGSWGMVSKDNSELAFLINCNLIINDGQLDIKGHQYLVIGKVPGYDGEHFNLEVEADGTLQLGEDGSWNGGTVVWNNGHSASRYTYWYGAFKVYASKFSMYGYGYVALTISGEFIVKDSSLSSMSQHTYYISSGASGEIIRSTIGCYYLYNYSPNIDFDIVTLVKSEAGANPYGMLSGTASYVCKINAMDFDDYIKATVCQSSTLAIIDCSNFADAQMNMWGNYTMAMHLLRKFTFEITIVDEDDTAIDNVKVTLRDTDGRSALFEDLTAIHASCRISGLSSDADTGATCIDSTRYAVGDILKVRGELMNVDAKPTGTTLTVTRNLTGSTANGRLSSLHTPFIRKDYVLTNASGKLLYDTDKKFTITIKDYPRLNNVNLTAKSFNPFTFRLEKAGYEIYEQEITLDEEIDWKIKLRRSPYKKTAYAG